MWPGAAFIVEALLLLVFLTGSLAVLMNLNAEADRIGRESADLMDGLVLASNVAEEFAADPIAFKEAYEADPMADRLLSQPAHEVENGSDLLSAECAFRTEDTEAGTMHYLTLEVWKVRVLNDSAKAAEEGIGFAPGGLCFEKCEESPAYTLETSRYVPAMVPVPPVRLPVRPTMRRGRSCWMILRRRPWWGVTGRSGRRWRGRGSD